MMRVVLLLLVLAQFNAFAIGEDTRFTIVQLRYRGDWNARPTSARRLLYEVVKRTSVDARLRIITATADDTVIFEHPFLYMTGDGGFEPFTEAEIANLRKFLMFGGLLFADDASGLKNSAFDRCFRREIARIFPDSPLKPLGKEHPVYISFYLLDGARGRVMMKPELEGVTYRGFTCVIYSRNDIGGALASDGMGNWEFDVVPGGEAQRELAIRLGVNIVMYALTADYKLDSIHSPFIRRRRW